MNNEYLKNPPKKYRPIPFWSWNEKLDTEETRKQIREMNDAGIGGYFMHARGGLQTEYLSDEWYDNVLAAVDEGRKLGMQSWGYDENGWPSGFGGGAVCDLGEKYQQKYLRCSETENAENTPRTIANVELNGKNLHFYYEVNPFYVDTMSKEVIAEFIRVTHEQYKEKLGKDFADMNGFFTDEPQISRKGFPWSFELEKAYKERHGEELAPLLPALFFDTDGCKRVRYNYWALVRDLFAEAFMKQIDEWCQENGSALTGHMVIEEGFADQILSNGACMPHYEYLDIPGMDKLGRSIADLQCEMQVVSVANQLGKKQVLSETFALCGWNVSFEDLRYIYEHQMVHGINYLCQHLEGYSLRGIRKRDYPASLFKHQPWWEDYKIFNDMVSRIGYIVAEGEVKSNVLVLHTIESGWTTMRDTVTDKSYTHLANGGETNVWCDKLRAVMDVLEKNQIQYHLGDDRILSRHGSVENGKLVVGRQSYSAVIVPPAETLGKTALELLTSFKAQGGKVIFVEKVPEYVAGIKDGGYAAIADKVVSCAELAENIPDEVRLLNLSNGGKDEYFINALVRGFGDTTAYYLYNRHNLKQAVTFTAKGKSAVLFDAVSGEILPIEYSEENGTVCVSAELQPKSSVMVFVYDDKRCAPLVKAEHKNIPLTTKLAGDWEIVSDEDNILTLDYCDVYFNGECAGKNVPISDVQEMALAFGKKVKTEVVFKFNVKEKAFSRLKLALETPEIFTIRVNGSTVENKVIGKLHDNAFNLVDIAPFVCEGKNEVSLTCDFVQSEQVYQMAKDTVGFESVRNRLYYDLEIEAVYIAGDFSVESETPFEKLENRGMRTNGGFNIVKKQKTVSVGALAQQGYPFFAGKVTYRKAVTLTAEEAKNASIKFTALCSNVTEVKVNGKDAGKILWHPYEIPLAGIAVEGENVFEITVKGNLRNMLGPFHLGVGESTAVGPGSFFHCSPVWLTSRKEHLNPDWVDSYCFVEFGLFLQTEE